MRSSVSLTYVLVPMLLKGRVLGRNLGLIRDTCKTVPRNAEIVTVLAFKYLG